MNVVFHAVAGAALASALYRGDGITSRTGYGGLCVGAFLLGIIGHGVMDVLPHQYPLRAGWDIVLAMAVFVGFALFLRRDAVLLFCFAYLGSLFPDLVDLGPRMLNQFAGTALPVSKAKVFFWHRPEYSGSIYDGRHVVLSWVLHGLVVGVSAGGIVHGRRTFSNRPGGRRSHDLCLKPASGRQGQARRGAETKTGPSAPFPWTHPRLTCRCSSGRRRPRA